MASTTALFTGLAGLNVNARRLEVIGNNIANINTTAFKSSRVVFSPTFSRDFSLGTAPSGDSGGANPTQVGLGVTIAGTQRNFSNGGISNTGVSTDLALEGPGFFIVNRGDQQYFTRAGAFQRNSLNQLTTIQGDRVQGYGIDEDFVLQTGSLVDITIPLGTLPLQQATSSVIFNGNLNQAGPTATQGSLLQFTDAAIASGATLLTALGGGTAVVAGDEFRVSGASRGGKLVPDAVFTVGGGSTIDDLMTFLQDALGVVPDGGFTTGEPTGGPEPGDYTVSAGLVDFVGNWGTANDLVIDAGNLQLLDSTGAGKTNPLGVAKLASADGESVRTSFTAYDSVGNSIAIDVTMVKAFQDSTGTYWRSFLHSDDDTDLALALESGDRTGTFSDAMPLLQFDEFGRILPTSAQIPVEIDRLNIGSVDPLNVTLNFASGSDAVTSISDEGGGSTLVATFQDGAPLGVLSSFSVGTDGVITGGFTNGLTRTIGQIAIGVFTNPEGLIDVGDNLFRTGANSGAALITTPLNLGAGRILGGALELSNTDLSQEFINMILTSTGYSASSRVITTTDQLIQQLLTLGA